MSSWLLTSLAHAACGASGCTLDDADVAQVTTEVRALVQQLDRDRPAEVQHATFALG